ncbi:MAG: tetratricopeptide repeat protein [Alphaproteobacteria bacterium]
MVFRLLFCALAFIILTLPSAASALDVSLRAADHDGYSRLVLNWPQKTKFTVEKNAPSTLTIAFTKNASVTVPDVSGIRNIGGIQIQGEAPLTLTLSIPRQSEYRGFNIGGRAIIDIYDAKGGAPAPQIKAQAEPAKPAPEETHKEHHAENVKIVAKAPVEPVEKKPLSVVPRVLPATPDLISMSSSQSFGLAVFARGDKLIMINDKADSILDPQISGPNAQALSTVKKKKLTGAVAFETTMVEGAYLRTQGGGLLWKIILAATPSKTKPIPPQRMKVIEGKERSGSILWPLSEPGKIIDYTDPLTGLPLKIITTKTAADYAGGLPQRFVDFDVLPAAIGLVIVPKRSDLSIKLRDNGVIISHPEGLAILSESRMSRSETLDATPEKDASHYKMAKGKTPTKHEEYSGAKIFDFKHWQLGGEDALRDNRSIILASLHKLPQSARNEGLMSLAKMYLSNAMGAEALGFLGLIADNTPEIVRTPEFLAIRGAARALDMKTRNAFTDLSIPALSQFEEIGFWRAFALADLGDWRQAIAIMPRKADAIKSYPPLIFNKLGLAAAEIALRAGNVGMADELLLAIAKNKKSLSEQQTAALTYLKGEAARQDGDTEATTKLWKPLLTGADELYRARAGLALTRLLVDTGKIDGKEAIDNLERLRYAWRGDDLERQINYWLGRTYFENREYVKGLNILREAMSFSAGTRLGKRIANQMSEVFINLYLTDELKTLSPLTAVALYEQFTELVPTDKRGNLIVENLADRLVKADLLGRAAGLLDYQLTHRLKGLEAYGVGTKLAAIYLLDDKSAEALTALEKATAAFETLPEEQKTTDKSQTISLLNARAISREGQPDQAIALLETLPATVSVNQLRADIAWNAGYWDDAAAALQAVILDKDLSLTRPLEKEDATLILNHAIALNLAGDRISLANLREKYAQAMSQTQKSRIFDVITRPRQTAVLADRDTLLDIVSEVDLFSDFLENYRAVSE